MDYCYGFAIQLVESADVAKVQEWIDSKNLTQLESYICQLNGKGFTIQNQPICNTNSSGLMVCFVERVTSNIRLSDEEITAPFAPQINRIMGLPVIESGALGNLNQHPKIHISMTNEGTGHNETMPSVRHINVPSLNGISLVRDDVKNAIAICMPYTTHSLTPFSNELSPNSPDMIFLNERKDAQAGWKSLHVSTISSSVDVVSFVMNMIPKERQVHFIRDVGAMGWISLHWEAYRNDGKSIEDDFSNLTINKSRGALTTSEGTQGWTLLQCTTHTHSVTTMKGLMRMFPGNDNRWSILSCKATNQKDMTLHIAVAEASVKAVIMLFENGNAKQEDIKIDSPDSNRNNLSDFSLLGQYLRLSLTEMDLCPVLYKAVKVDDSAMVQFIFKHSLVADTIALLNKQNVNGRTVIQEACKYNSIGVLEYFLDLLDKTDKGLHRCLLEFSAEGDTAMHIAALYHRPRALHMILKAVKRDKRLGFIQSKNQKGETVEEVGKPHDSILDTLKYHTWISKQDLLKLFKQHKYSLFNIDIKDDDLHRLYKVIEKCRASNELGYKRNINYDTVKCLLMGDFMQAKHLPECALKTGPLCIHSLCNLGVYLLTKSEPEQNEAEEIALQVLELFCDSSEKFQLSAKIDYAYWYAESLQTDEARAHSCEMFEECVNDSRQCEDSNTMREYCSYFYVKTLVRTLRKGNAHLRPSDWTTDVIQKVVHHLGVLTYGEEKLYRGDIWLWLAELQVLKIEKVAKDILVGELENFRKSTNIVHESVDTSVETCLNKAFEMRNKYDYELKFLMRLSRLCTEVAFGTFNLIDRKHWLLEAIKWSEHCSGQSEDWYFMCSCTISKALISLWVMDFYQRNWRIVKEEYYRRTGRRLVGPDHSGKEIQFAWMFLEHEFYNGHALSNDSLKENLQKALDHLTLIVNKGEGWKSHGVKVARVMCLLSYPSDKVIDTFNRALDAADTMSKEVQVLQSLGRFYEILGNVNSAIYYYNIAVTLYNTNRASCKKPILARNGLYCLTGRCVVD